MTTSASDNRRLRSELHDRVLQPLAAALRQLELRDLQPESDGAQARGHIATAEAALHEALTELRAIIAGAAVDGAGASGDGQGPDLGSTLRAFAGSPVTRGVDVQLQLHGDLSSLPLTVQTEAFLILREAICNALEHGHPTTIAVRVDRTAGQLRASVEDDGAGFDLDRATAGVGLASMGDRAARLGGAASVTTSPGGATRVDLVVPLAGSAP